MAYISDICAEVDAIHREGSNDYRVLVRVKIIIKISYGSPLYWPPYRKVSSVGLQKVLPCYHLVHANQKDLKAMELTSAEVVKSGGVWSGILPWAKCQWILKERVSDNCRKIPYY